MSIGTGDSRGFTLVELVIVIVIVGILATVATHKMSSSIETARCEHTKKEMAELAWAIVGNPCLYGGGSRVDFGYLGDVGALPPDLGALVQNPGSYATWNGPYITRGIEENDFKEDAWNTTYVYSDTLIRSTGSGSNIDKVFANSSAALLSNTVEGVVVDADRNVPGMVYRDSLVVCLIHPDGLGGMDTVSVNPSSKGNFSITSVPVGLHVVRVIYLPDTDTLSLTVGVNPSSTVKVDIAFPADLW